MGYVGPDLTKVYVQQVSKKWDATIMTAIAGAESGWRADAKSPTDDWGLFQINKYWHQALFRQYEWYNPFQNTEMAYAVWKSQHYHAWSTYNSGAYLRYMKQSAGGGNVPQGVGQGATWDQVDQPAPGAGGMDYSHVVKNTGGRAHHAFNQAGRYGHWLRSLR
jgi:hypothetical protein